VVGQYVCVGGSGSENAELIRRNFERLAAGDASDVFATWHPEAQWHILDHAGLEGTYSRDDYFALLGQWSEMVTDYRLGVVSCEAYGDELVVAYIRSTGTSAEGPVDENGGLMIYRVVDGLIVEGWAVSRGRDARLLF